MQGAVESSSSADGDRPDGAQHCCQHSSSSETDKSSEDVPERRTDGTGVPEEMESKMKKREPGGNDPVNLKLEESCSISDLTITVHVHVCIIMFPW